MRPLVNHRGVALAGLLGMAGIAVLILLGTVDLVGAAQRAAALLLALLLVERVALPVARALVGPAAEPDEPVAGA